MTGRRIAVFVDRDGTLNEEVEFIRKPDELILIPGAAASIKALNDLGVLTCVISNQSGIARGFLTEADLIPIHARLEENLHQGGARLDRIYYCPHHPHEGFPPYRQDCDCRKPKPGMLLRAARELSIDLTRSYVVGDRVADVLVGQAVGATTILVLTGYGKASAEECAREKITPDRIVPSIVEAAGFIQEKISHGQATHA